MFIWIVIVAVAIISSIIKRINKANNSGGSNYKKPFTNQPPTTYNKPKNTQPKSLEDILQSLLGEQKQVTKPVTKPVQQTQVPPIVPDKQQTKFTTLEDTGSFENIDDDHYVGEDKYYGLDTELNYEKETEDFDIIEDHRLHGAGFDQVMVEVVEEESEWETIDWRKAVITAEILRRPEY